MAILAHLDIDAFFAAVEEIEEPSLAGKPLVVGGDPRSRGVVATANYAARAFGVHSAMSAAEAARRCPTAVFVRPRHALYRPYSATVWAAVPRLVPRVERGLQDAAGHAADARELLARLRRATVAHGLDHRLRQRDRFDPVLAEEQESPDHDHDR